MAKVILKSTKKSLSSSNSGGLSPYEPRASEVNGIVPLNEDNITHIEQGIQKIIQETNLALEETASKEYVDELIATPIPSPAQHANKFLKVKTDGSGLEYGEGGGGSSYVPMIEITWAELKALRDNEELVPGQRYRITDYVATTRQNSTKSAEHQFDIIVVADDERTLNENARAIQHDWGSETKEVPTAVQEASQENPISFDFVQTIDDEEIIYNREEEPEGRLWIDGVILTRMENDFPTLYKTDLEGYPDEPDMNDKFVWYDRFTIDNVTYDRWLKYENGTPTDNYYLTQIITSGSKEIIIRTPDYFDDCNLNSWELKYCLDNDINKFAWARNKVDEAILVHEDEDTIYVHIRCPEQDIDGKFAWAYMDTSDRPDFDSIMWDGMDPEDVGYTNTETIIPGETIFEYGDYSSPIIEYRKFEPGKGIIYYMKDNNNNECPYDFKNIQYVEYDENDNKHTYYTFTLEKITAGDPDIIVDKDYSLNKSKFVIDNCIGSYIDSPLYLLPNNIFIHDVYLGDSYIKNNKLEKNCTDNKFYTYANNSSGELMGNYLEYSCVGNKLYSSNYNKIGFNSHSNTIKQGEYNDIKHNCWDLNITDSNRNSIGIGCYNIELFDYSHGNIIGKGCNGIHIYNNSNYNTIGESCGNITFTQSCNGNTIGNQNYNISFNEECSWNSVSNGCNVINLSKNNKNNSFGNRCASITLYEGSNNNSFGNWCNNITLSGVSNNSNSFGNECTNITVSSGNSNMFGNRCYNIDLSSGCNSNTFENDCHHITFYNICNNNHIGNGCSNIEMGMYCTDNTIGNNCNYIKLVSYYTNYASKNTIEDGCSFIDLLSNDNPNLGYLQNITIKKGIQGDSSNWKVIREQRNLQYDVIYRAEGAEDKYI